MKTFSIWIFIGALIWCSGRPWSKVPAVADLLDPFHGFWSKTERLKIADRKFSVSGLKAPAKVIWDSAYVPHMIAESHRDLAWLQGFVHASQRLFQMEVQARSGGGRLEPLVGKRARPMDQQAKRIGLPFAAKQSLQIMMADPMTRELVEFYVAGVNAWIAQLSPKDYPTEFHLLGKKPEEWRPMHVAEFFSIMIYRLTGRSADLSLTSLAKEFGIQRVRDLFLDELPREFEAPFIPVPSKDAVASPKPPEDAFGFLSQWTDFPELLKPFRSNGSNNWALAPQKSISGRVILANDTHLGLSVPGVWFEQQLITRESNVYGAGFSGVPGVLSGFTKSAGWAVTNGGIDVIDWYQLQFEDNTSLKYKIDEVAKEAWVDDWGITWTELGPVFERKGHLALVLKWAAHEGSNPLKVFNSLNRIATVEDCENAIATFHTPIQNFICADQNNISITQAGAVPLRWKGQGQFVMNGNKSDWIWKELWPTQQVLKSKNPQEGFVSSANQRAVLTNGNPYLGWESENSYRGTSVQQNLKAREKWEIFDVIAMQTDNLNPLAKKLLPQMLKGLSLSTELEKEAANALSVWDFYDRPTSSASAIFLEWWRQLKNITWEDQLGPDAENSWPKDQRLDFLMSRVWSNDLSDAFWIDDTRTEKKETLEDLLNQSFQKACQVLAKDFGPSVSAWQLATYRPVQFPHLGRIPGLGTQIGMGGSRHAINAIQSFHGPTWRMVVEFKDPVEAYTSTPTSAPGDPLSFQFLNGISEWSQGLYKQVFFVEPGRYELPHSHKVGEWTFAVEN